MKRFLSFLLVLCLVPVFACALDLENFNVYSSVVGVKELDPEKGVKTGNFTAYLKDDCYLYFRDENGKIDGIVIEGEGYTFLAYCCAAIYSFDPDGSQIVNNGGLLTNYLFAHTHTETQYGITTNGVNFLVKPSEEGYTFIIGE